MPLDAGVEVIEHVRELIGDQGKVVAEAGALPLHLCRDNIERLPLVQPGNPQHHREDDCSYKHAKVRPELEAARRRHLLELGNHDDRCNRNAKELALDIDDGLVDLAYEIQSRRFNLIADLRVRETRGEESRLDLKIE